MYSGRGCSGSAVDASSAHFSAHVKRWPPHDTLRRIARTRDISERRYERRASWRVPAFKGTAWKQGLASAAGKKERPMAVGDRGMMYTRLCRWKEGGRPLPSGGDPVPALAEARRADHLVVTPQVVLRPARPGNRSDKVRGDSKKQRQHNSWREKPGAACRDSPGRHAAAVLADHRSALTRWDGIRRSRATRRTRSRRKMTNGASGGAAHGGS